MNFDRVISWFKPQPVVAVQPTNYPAQVLNGKQKSTIDYLDALLVSQSTDPKPGYRMKLTEVGLTLSWQWKTNEEIEAALKSQLTITNVCYMPRNIAFLVDPDGNWRFVIGYYEVTEALDSVTSLLFSDALVRTNAARAE